MDRNEIIKFFGGKFILGAAYFRIVPGRADWPADMRRMKDIGFDSVKIQVEWERVNPRKNEYFWEESDGLMDVAAKTGLKVMFQIPLETVPERAYREHGAERIELDRKTAPVMTLLGGIMKWSVCWDNPGLLAEAHDFVVRIVTRYKDHPALLCWDVC